MAPEAPDYEFPEPAQHAAWTRVLEQCLITEDIYPGIARRLLGYGVRRFLEVGGGDGPISRILAAEGVAAVVLDLEPQALAGAPPPAVRADMTRLPLPNGAFDAVAAVNCLYFLTDPAVAVREALRVLRSGGVYVASSPSRYNDPEISHLVDDPWAGFFDAEDAPAIVGSVFGEVEVETWDLVAFRLLKRQDVVDYLHAFRVPDFEARAQEFELPLSITKRGAQVWARRTG